MGFFQGVRQMMTGWRTRDAPASGSLAQATTKTPLVAFLSGDAWGSACALDYVTLDRCPEIMTACRKIASLIGSTTIHLMQNTTEGDIRIVDELSRLIDIQPMPNMTRNAWMEAIVMNLLMYGSGNSIVLPHWERGYLRSLEPVSASRVALEPVPASWRDYKIRIDGTALEPDEVIHFTFNPDALYPWKGRGLSVSLRDVAANLRQAAKTERAFLASEYKPSVIVKVDALTDEFSSPEGRQRLVESYLRPSEPGAPWLIPAEQFDVTQVKPLTLSDLAIAATVEMDRRAIAAILGVPPFVVGVGDYKAAEWNAFIQTTVMSLCKAIAAELTRKLIHSPEMYLRFNVWSLLDFDLQKVSTVLLQGSDRGFVNGDEWRDRLHLPPAGLTEYRVLENYIPADMAGDQKKLNGGGDE